MQLFYNPAISEKSSEIIFDKKESGHIIKVLRKALGDILWITNGKGFLFEAEIIQDNQNKCIVKILRAQFHETSNYHLHLVVAPTKRNERFEWFLEKATEMGVHEITPIICEHSERKTIKLDRFERIIESAMKQSLQYYLPKLNKPIAFADFMAKDFEGEKFIAHCEDTRKDLLKNKVKPTSKTTILIGPEGDFSSEEIDQALKSNFQPISLGDNRLRTETAAIAACHTVYLANQF